MKRSPWFGQGVRLERRVRKGKSGQQKRANIQLHKTGAWQQGGGPPRQNKSSPITMKFQENNVLMSLWKMDTDTDNKVEFSAEH